MGWQETLSWPRLVLFLVVVFLLLTFVDPFARKALQNLSPQLETQDKDVDAWCPLPTHLPPASDGIASSTTLLDQASLTLQVERLSSAVNVATVSYDDAASVENDPRWKTFDTFHTVLRDLFPLVHEKTQLEKVNKYGLLYTLKGSSDEFKPAMFMAHQDVVPASDPSKWTHPPFEAYYDAPWLYGRGSVDCKNGLIGLLSTLENLLAQDFRNKRTIMFSFGFDEETGGANGAKFLAAHIEQKLGKDSLAMILDEGGMGVSSVGDVTYAYPAVAEKGYVDIIMTLETPGGHSSRPPSHSAIGIMSELVIALEQRTFLPVVDSKSPFRGVLECQAKYSAGKMEPWLKEALKNPADLGRRIAEARGDSARWLMQTSQAVDIIQGGSKDNQLPERVVTTINYRVLPTDNIDTLLTDTAKLLAPVAHNHSIGVDGFGFADTATPSGLLNLTSKYRLSPSPIAPSGSSGPDTGIWNVFAATIAHVYANTTSPSTGQKTRLVVPVGTLMTGNTDTVHYWDLTRNIYRFSPRREGTAEGVHTVDERLDVRSHLEGMRLYHDLIRNLDVYEGN